MRLTVMTQTAKGLPEMVGEGEDQEPLRSEVLKTIKSIKWYLWHGNVFQALQHLRFLEMDLQSAAFESPEETTRKLLKAVEEFSTYIERNGGFIPNHGERYRNGERISTGFVESTINQGVAWPRSSRCSGLNEERTCYCRSVLASSTRNGRMYSAVGIPISVNNNQ
jgi:hypothetical protein